MSGPGFAEWPTDPLAIATDFDSGDYVDSTEAAGWSADEQERIIQQCVNDDYRWLVVSIVYGGGNAHPGSTYDGYKELINGSVGPFTRWLTRLVAARITPILVPFQGSGQSLAAICAPPYDNDWGKRNLSFIASKLRTLTSAHAGFMWGFEVNKYADSPDGNPEHRGVSNLWGWNGICRQTAALKSGWSDLLVLVHPLPDTRGPVPDEGGRSWDSHGWWRGQGIDPGGVVPDGIAFQVDLDGEHNDSYYIDYIAWIKDVLPANKLCYAMEYVRPGWSFPHSHNVGTPRAKHLGDLMLAHGVRGVMNARGRV